MQSRSYRKNIDRAIKLSLGNAMQITAELYSQHLEKLHTLEKYPAFF